MKWTIKQIQLLKKKDCGKGNDDEVSQKMAELNAHLDNYEKSFLRHNTRHEWLEVERIADEISGMIEFHPADEPTKRCQAPSSSFRLG